MPAPEIAPIPLPVDESDSARVFLEAHGITPVQPPVRSSDEELLLSDPFLYYLTRRLGLSPLLSYTETLNRGSWFHTVAESFTQPDPVAAADARLSRRLKELADLCTAHSVLPSALRTFQDYERRDFETTLAWFEAALDVPFAPSSTLRSYLASMQILGTELTLSHTLVLNGQKIPLRVTVDALLYCPRTKTIRIADYKTCSESPTVRLAKCTLEMATSLYSFVVSELITSGFLLSKFSLPADTVFGGFDHIAIQKPTIEFGQKDRPFKDVEFTPSKGPNKGITRITREYFGEPSYSRYLARCRDWYHRDNEYASSPFEDGPPVNISHISPSFIKSPLILSRLYSRIQNIFSFSTRQPIPCNFHRNPSGIYKRFSNKPSPFAHFYLEPVHTWPEYIAQERFVVNHRDDPHSPSGE